jgi:hypothetical protein
LTRSAKDANGGILPAQKNFKFGSYVMFMQKEKKRRRKREKRKMWHTTNYCTLLSTNKNTIMLQ